MKEHYNLSQCIIRGELGHVRPTAEAMLFCGERKEGNRWFVRSACVELGLVLMGEVSSDADMMVMRAINFLEMPDLISCGGS
ncbi:hypothetical protein CUMW_196340 [Citrus unshiu]|nr:hypothetical protein CUMW_196340 [Citrus unshiu]